MKPPYISIIVPVLNGQRHIRQCLNSLTGLDYPGGSYEIIVVDNGSTDGTVETVKRFGQVRLLTKKDARVGGVRNHGARYSKGEILAFIDSDCVARSDWLVKGSKCLNAGETGVAGAHYNLPEGCSLIGRAWAARSRHRNRYGDITYVPAGNLFITKKLFESIGGFNDEMESSEDVDLCHRVREAGYRVFSDPLITVYHLGDDITLRRFFWREVWRGGNVVGHYIRYRKRSYLKATLIALYYLLISMVIVLSMAMKLVFNVMDGLIPASLAMTVAPPIVLSFMDVRRHRVYRYFLITIVLHLTFGAARAFAVVCPKR